MKHGLLFYGVNICGDKAGVRMRVQDAFLIFSYHADPGFAFGDEAAVAAQAAQNLIPFFFLVQQRFAHFNSKP
jgi:hypothetical protein